MSEQETDRKVAESATDKPEAGQESPQPEAAQPAAEAPPAEQAPPENTAEKTVYCSQCGAEMRPDDRFCHYCGWDTQAPVAPLPPPPRVVPNPSEYNRLAALLLCIFLGFLGVHRFYVGKVGTGLIWLFTAGFFFIGVVYDLILIATGEFRDSDGRRLMRWE